MSRLALYLLGPPRLERDGVPLKIDRRKAIALLAYLAVTGQSHRRDSLVNLLWPDCDTARGRAALRRTLYALRKALGGTWLDVDRDEIGLQPGAGQAHWVDVDQFHRHLAQCETHGHPASQTCPACVTPLTDAVALVRCQPGSTGPGSAACGAGPLVPGTGPIQPRRIHSSPDPPRAGDKLLQA